MKSVRVFPDPEAMADEVALQWQEEANLAEKEGRVFSVVLSGASTAERIYRRLAEKDCAGQVPWHVVHIFWADDRCVPPENEESNYGNCRRFLLSHIPIPTENIHRIRGEDDPAGESTRYDQEIRDHMVLRKGQTTFFDWVFLGVGPDGHTASLFAGHDTLNSLNLCEDAQHPQTGQMRVTMTPCAIKNSDRITYHVIGQKSADIVSKLLSKSDGEPIYPADHISGEWYLDGEAASNLNPGLKDS